MTLAERAYVLDFLYFELLPDDNIWLRPIVAGETDDPDRASSSCVFVMRLRPNELSRFYVPVDRDPYEMLPEILDVVGLHNGMQIRLQDE
jgi:hypothetical protein